MQKRKRRGREIQKSENKAINPKHCVEFRNSTMRIAREFLLKTTEERWDLAFKTPLFPLLIQTILRKEATERKERIATT